MMSEPIDGLATAIARNIFACGDESPACGGKTQRIQFLGGEYPDNEIAMGGLNENSLKIVIARAIVCHMRDKAPIQEE